MTAPPFLLTDPTLTRVHTTTDNIVDATIVALEARGFVLQCCDDRKPWGVEFKLDGTSGLAVRFRDDFFGDLEIGRGWAEPVAPKILLIREAHRLSWHFHERKDALLRVLHGNIGASLSQTDVETPPRACLPGEEIRIPPLFRHRLSSLSGWAVVAEIGRDVLLDWPSDDDDTHRIRDDYGR